jgi:hypothetical protein
MKAPVISPSFRKLFPHAAECAAELGLYITSGGGKRVNGLPTFWMEGTYQLTGFKTKADGSPFTKDDAAEHIQKLLEQITAGRVETEGESREQRFARLIDGMRALEPRFKTFATYRHPSGDEGTILFLGDPVTAWVRFWDQGQVAHAENVPLTQLYAVLNASFANGGKTIAAKAEGRT